MVTHTEVKSIPKVKNTKINSPRESCYRGARSHTLNTLPRFHTLLASARIAKMNNLRELASIISLLLLFRHSSAALLCHCFIQRRIRRQRLRLPFINAIAHSIYYLTARQNDCACARAPKLKYLGSSTSTNVVSAASERSCTTSFVERKLQSY